jgi:hypothetical protein
MGKAKSGFTLPGFVATSSLDTDWIYYQTTNRQNSLSDTKRSIVSQRRMEAPPPGCILLGPDGEDGIYCFDDGGGDGGMIGGVGGAARSVCISGDGKKVCRCPKNCFSSDTQCWCINYPPA